MPISAIDGCSEHHWQEVLDILVDASSAAEFDANLVSNADEVGFINKRIIEHLYENPIAICDVSGKNPNVMFELGMRLAFDKPTIIIKDDKTTYSFDIGGIEHLAYPRDLRYATILEFKQRLSDKLAATFKAASTDDNYTTFLKHFGEFTVAKLDKKELPSQQYVLEELKDIRQILSDLQRSQVLTHSKAARSSRSVLGTLRFPGKSTDEVKSAVKRIQDHPHVSACYAERVGSTYVVRFKTDIENVAALTRLFTTEFGATAGTVEVKRLSPDQ